MRTFSLNGSLTSASTWHWCADDERRAGRLVQAFFGTFCVVSIGQDPLPRASPWHHIHQTHRKATEITEDAGHLGGRTRFFTLYAQSLADRSFALPGTKIKRISAADVLRFWRVCFLKKLEEDSARMCVPFFLSFLNGDESCVKICWPHFREELSLSHLLAGGVGFTRGHLLWHWVWKSWRILWST